MKNFFSICCCFILIDSMYAQSVSINTDGSQPNASAMLDIKNANKGLLIPRVSLASETDVSTIPSPATSLLVFNTNAALPDGLGFYFWNSNNKWSKLATVNAANNIFWGLGGNVNINPATDFIGTTDAKPLVFKTNNILSGKIDPLQTNAFFGQYAGITNTSGHSNSFFGHDAGSSVTTAFQNSFFGYGSGKDNTTGSNNSAFGYGSLTNNLTGSMNTATGIIALAFNTTGSYNTGTGGDALWTNTSGSFNTATGSHGLYKNDLGNSNIAMGYSALYNNSSGSYNTAIGNRALDINTTGTYNVAVGYNANASFSYLTDLTYATVIGANASVLSSNTMSFGNPSVWKWAFGLSTTGFGHAMEVGSSNINGNGAYLTTGGTWTNTSSRMKKENFSELNGNDLLQKISQLSIQKWKYKGTDEYHIGPVAEDFYKAFGLGTDNKGISTVDPSGIALAAIKEQQQIIEKQSDLINELEKRIEALEKK